MADNGLIRILSRNGKRENEFLAAGNNLKMIAGFIYEVENRMAQDNNYIQMNDEIVDLKDTSNSKLSQLIEQFAELDGNNFKFELNNLLDDSILFADPENNNDAKNLIICLFSDIQSNLLAELDIIDDLIEKRKICIKDNKEEIDYLNDQLFDSVKFFVTDMAKGSGTELNKIEKYDSIMQAGSDSKVDVIVQKLEMQKQGKQRNYKNLVTLTEIKKSVLAKNNVLEKIIVETQFALNSYANFYMHIKKSLTPCIMEIIRENLKQDENYINDLKHALKNMNTNNTDENVMLEIAMKILKNCNKYSLKTFDNAFENGLTTD